MKLIYIIYNSDPKGRGLLVTEQIHQCGVQQVQIRRAVDWLVEITLDNRQ